MEKLVKLKKSKVRWLKKYSSSLSSSKKKKKQFTKMEKRASMKAEMRSRKARKLIDKTLKVADRPVLTRSARPLIPSRPPQLAVQAKVQSLAPIDKSKVGIIMRRTAKKKQNKFLNYMLTPIRILKRARQLYIKGVQDCAGGLGYGGVGHYSTFQISQLPAQSFNFKSLRHSGGGNINEQLRKVHIRNIYVENERRLVVHGQKQPNVGCNGTRNSSSVGLRNMGTIDEDKPCYFEEDQIDTKTRPALHPRRS